MTDLEMKEITAEAMGYELYIGFVCTAMGHDPERDDLSVFRRLPQGVFPARDLLANLLRHPSHVVGERVLGHWNPFKYDDQAMALVKLFTLFCEAPVPIRPEWEVFAPGWDSPHVKNADLNRAIVETVAKMQAAAAAAHPLSGV